MPDLQLGPPPTVSPLRAILIAAAALAAAAAAVFYLNPTGTAVITCTDTHVIAPHTVMRPMPGAVHVIGAAPEAEDDLYIATRVSITNKLRLPLFVKEVTAVLKAPDASVADADVILPADMPAVAKVFPQLAALTQTPLPRDATIAPGATVEGIVMLHFPQSTAARWTARKQATLTVNFFHQTPQTVVIP